ncbi:unnamed protein product [Ixodes hexagonus]
MEDDWRNRTLWCGGLDPKVTEDLLRELFVQAGPVEEVKIPKDSGGQLKSFAFVTFVHADSLAYSLALLEGTCLYGRRLKLERRPRAAVDDKYVDMMNRHYEHVRARKVQKSQSGRYLQLGQYPQHNQYQNLNQYPHRGQYPNQGQYPQPTQYPQRSQYAQYHQYPQHSQYPLYGQYPQYRQCNQYNEAQAYVKQCSAPPMYLGPPPALPLPLQRPPVHTYVPTPIHTYVPTPIRDLGDSLKSASYSGQRVPAYFTGSLKKEDSLADNNGCAPRQQLPSSRRGNDECASEESYYSKRTRY